MIKAWFEVDKYRNKAGVIRRRPVQERNFHPADWKLNEIKSWHRLRSATKQGPKLSVNEIERRREAERAREWWEQATAAGLKGDRRDQWVMGRLGWDPRTDESRLRRLMRTRLNS